MRLNLNEISKSAVRKLSQEKEKNDDYISTSSPVILKFKEDGLFHELKIDDKSNNKINIHNSTPSYNNSKVFYKTGKFQNKSEHHNNFDFDNFRKNSKH